MAENYALVELLRAAWENGIGFGATGFDEWDQAVNDSAFATWLKEHAAEVASMLAQFGGQVAEVERARLARNVRGLQGPMAWRRFRMKYSAVAERGSAQLVRAISDEMASGWEA